MLYLPHNPPSGSPHMLAPATGVDQLIATTRSRSRLPAPSTQKRPAAGLTPYGRPPIVSGSGSLPTFESHRRDAQFPEDGWYKSSRSMGNGSCVEIRSANAKVFVRDSKEQLKPDYDPATEPIVSLSIESFGLLIDGIAQGEKKVSVDNVEAEIAPDHASILSLATGIKLNYTSTEWQAFEYGIRNGEFTFDPATRSGIM